MVGWLQEQVDYIASGEEVTLRTSSEQQPPEPEHLPSHLTKWFPVD